jgi:hypothetical protein
MKNIPFKRGDILFYTDLRNIAGIVRRVEEKENKWYYFKFDNKAGGIIDRDGEYDIKYSSIGLKYARVVGHVPDKVLFPTRLKRA